MSALPNLNRQQAPSRRLQLVDAIQGRQANPSAVVVSLLALFALVVSGLYLTFFVITTTSQYQLAGLKEVHAKVLEDTQILQQQVDSLSSNQNLSDAAEVLGMVSNANPVFLNVGEQKVYGEPKAALRNTTGRVSGNLVGNSVMSAKTSPSALRAAVAEQEKAATRTVKTMKASATTSGGSKTASQSTVESNFSATGSNVATAKSKGSQVGSLGGQIPTSPTH